MVGTSIAKGYRYTFSYASYNYAYDAAWEKTVPTFRAYYRLLAWQQAKRKYNQIDSYLK